MSSGGGSRVPDQWFASFFDELYYETYSVFESEDRNEAEARFIVDALGLPSGSRVLDLGCGYGRHAVYLAKWGYRVVCFDLSDFMLDKARARAGEFGVSDRVEIVRGDMRDLSYTEEFDGVYMFFTTYGYFSDEENRDVLHRVSRALKPGGSFLLDLVNPFRIVYDAYTHKGSWRIWFKAGAYLVLEETVLDVDRGKLTTKRIFYREDQGRVIAERSFDLRIYMPWDVKEMLEDAGLSISIIYGSYREVEYTVSSPRMIIVSRKPKQL